MAASNVSISFGADASDFLEGVARVTAALQTLPSGVNQISQGIDKSSQSFAAFGVGATGALAKIFLAAKEAGASQQDVARAGEGAVDAEDVGVLGAAGHGRIMGTGARADNPGPQRFV